MCDVCGAGLCDCAESEGVGRPAAGSGTATPQPQAAQLLSTEASVLPTSSVWQGLDWGYSWSGKSVSYGFAAGAGDYASGYYSSYNEPSKFLSLSAAGQNIVRSAFAVWDAVAAITLYEAASGVHPLINVGGSSIPSTSWAYSPGSYDSSGDVWFGVDKSFMSRLVSGKGPYIGSYEYATALHEIGHALGLKHPHQGSPTVPTQYDGLEYTVMSYRSYVGGPVSYYTVETWGYPQSLMMLDIAEIQAIYGADYGTLSGNTTYRFDPATGEMTVNGVSAGQPGANRVFRTLWDGGGTDHIDLSNYKTDVEIDLTPGRGVDLDGRERRRHSGGAASPHGPRRGPGHPPARHAPNDRGRGPPGLHRNRGHRRWRGGPRWEAGEGRGWRNGARSRALLRVGRVFVRDAARGALPADICVRSYTSWSIVGRQRSLSHPGSTYPWVCADSD